MNTTIQVTTTEGVMVYTGVDHEGNSKWSFLKRLKDGTVVPSRRGPPRRMRDRLLGKRR